MITFMKRLSSAVPTPAAGKVTSFVDSTSGFPSFKDEAGVVTNLESAGNKVTAFSSPTNTQYPSALLVSNQLALKSNLAGTNIFNDTTLRADTVIQDGSIYAQKWTMDRSGTPSSIYALRGKLYVPAIINVPTLTVGNPGGGEDSGFYGEGLGNVIGNGSVAIFASHSARFWASPVGLIARSDAAIGWTTGTNPSNAISAALYREADNVISQYNSTAGQEQRLYNTRTDGSNYERAFTRWVSNVLEVGVEALGTGTTRTMRLNRLKGTTGAGSAALGANCPATTLTAPYSWVEVTTSDGSTAYVPAFK